MIWFEPLRWYLEANVALAVAYLTFKGLDRVSGGLPPRSSLCVGQWLLVGAFLVPGLVHQLPRERLLPPAAQVFSSATGPARIEMTTTAARAERASLTLPETGLAATGAWFLVGVLAASLLLAFRVIRLHRGLSRLPCWRAQGRVRILIGDGGAFATALGTRAYIVLPQELLADRKELLLAARHELQHLRNRDLVWLFLLEAIHILFWFNPAVALWKRWLRETQEFACDARLIGRGTIAREQYCRSLVQAAAAHLKAKGFHSAGTAGMALSLQGNLLKRRIEMILTPFQTNGRKYAALFVGLGTLAGVASVSFATRSALQPGLLTLNEARGYARAANRESGFPIVVNEHVLEQLNRFLGTPNGRLFIKNSLLRMPAYRPYFETRLAEAGLPLELIAVALVESGYVNQPQSSTDDTAAPGLFRGAGLWMFIAQTAKRYGLVVDGTIDERLDVAKETTAAIEYLTFLQGKFKDWHLAVAAYNQGENYVDGKMKETGIGDAWKLAELGHINNYLSKVTAAMIIVASPALHPK